jgi:hypothetical protein
LPSDLRRTFDGGYTCISCRAYPPDRLTTIRKEERRKGKGRGKRRKGLMTIKTRNGLLEAKCDECGVREASLENDFGVFLEYLKEVGWKNSRVRDDNGDEFVHLCPDCVDSRLFE